ncbi:MAG: threonine--tRNA ligase, partial [Dehalococcoidia bacterium]
MADLRHRIRHSAAHIMAEAVLGLFPNAKFAVGPATDDGFYYDFAVERPFTPEDLEAIEAAMRETIARDAKFELNELERGQARDFFARQPFKLEIIEGIPGDDPITTYTHNGFVDLCRGPHVESTSQVKAFKLMNVAGAYWRGDEKKEMLQRIYGTAWESPEALEEYLHRLEEAERRDHRKLGPELGLFFFNPIAPASPFFLPRGADLYQGLISYVRDLYQEYGYREVITPQIFDTELWKRSGHYDNYQENMYFTYVDEREFGVKPMNCPAHAMMFGSQLHSYRDLPLRYADFGRLHRYERSGVTHGLTRVRTFSQDDAHIFCAPEHVEGEIKAFIRMVNDTYKALRFDDVRVALSLRPDKRIGT